MKLILGDNQFFGINHGDLKKGLEVRDLFNSPQEILAFINKSLNLGLDGFMINSNEIGIEVIKNFNFVESPKECHFSIPYPHKYAGIVNESGMFALLWLVLNRVKFIDLIHVLRFLFTGNLKYLIPIILRIEIPNEVPKGSVIYLQNVVTDMILGLNNCEEIFNVFVKTVKNMGYSPGFITLNLDQLHKRSLLNHKNTSIYLCFNVNYSGFNVFPSKSSVEGTVSEIQSTTDWKLVGMSVFSSGREGVSIEQSISYIKSLKLDYIVFGSSKLSNIKSNINELKLS